jgi:hypothetical protein
MGIEKQEKCPMCFERVVLKMYFMLQLQLHLGTQGGPEREGLWHRRAPSLASP